MVALQAVGVQRETTRGALETALMPDLFKGARGSTQLDDKRSSHTRGGTCLRAVSFSDAKTGFLQPAQVTGAKGSKSIGARARERTDERNESARE